MNQHTVAQLNLLNKRFYESAGNFWNPNLNYYWDGWYKLIDLLGSIDQIHCLDIGCGNGRFAHFLYSNIRNFTSYVGVDFSANLIDLGSLLPNSHFFHHDILSQSFCNYVTTQTGQVEWNCITLWGLIHHIPGTQQRLKLVKNAAELLAPNGIFIVSTWQFHKVPRLIKRIVDYSTPEGKQIYEALGIDRNELEEGDEIVSWVKKITTYRYSHKFDDAEIIGYLHSAGLEIIEIFESDDRTQNRNKYFVCRKNFDS